MHTDDLPDGFDMDDLPQDLQDAILSPECPLCGGEGTDLGTLGRLAWYRCRQCGMDFSQARAADDTGDLDDDTGEGPDRIHRKLDTDFARCAPRGAQGSRSQCSLRRRGWASRMTTS